MAYLFVLIALAAVFWVIAIQPQRRRQQAHLAMQDAVDLGAEVITAGGLHGVVVELGERVVKLEVAEGVVVRVDRRAIAAIAEPEEGAPDELESAPEEAPEAR